jgi:hypothetical protein
MRLRQLRQVQKSVSEAVAVSDALGQRTRRAALARAVCAQRGAHASPGADRSAVRRPRPEDHQRLDAHAPLVRLNRSMTRLTAGGDNETFRPMSASDARASAISSATISLSVPSSEASSRIAYA